MSTVKKAVDIGKIKEEIAKIAEYYSPQNQFFYVRRPSFDILYVSSGVKELLGYNASHVQKNFFQLLSNSPINEEIISLRLQENRYKQLPALHMFLELTDTWGGKHLFDVTERELDAENGKVILGQCADASDKLRFLEEITRLRESAAMALKTRSAIINNISHKINNPLQALINSTFMGGDEAHQKEFAPLLEQVKRAGLKLSDWIDNLLEWAQTEAGETSLMQSKILLMDLIEDMKERYDSMAKAKNKRLHFSMDDELKRRELLVDFKKLSLIVRNLIHNSITYADAGDINIRFSIHRIDPLTEELHITVQDNGPGIDPLEIHHIFNVFSSVRRLAEKDIGLGLPLVYRLVKSMNGKLHINRKDEGKGVFEVVIPIQNDMPNDEFMNFAPLRKASMYLSPEYNLRVLVVEDEPVIRESISLYLRRENLEPTLAENGLIALQHLHLAPFDLILLDLNIPGVDGLEFLEKKRRTKMNYDTPVIAITGYSDTATRERLLSAGCKDVLSKPFGGIQLKRSVRRALDLGDEVN